MQILRLLPSGQTSVLASLPDAKAKEPLRWINGLAAAYFIARGAVHWPAALVMIVGAVVGGYAGARFARFIGRDKARAAVVVIGLAVAAILFLRR